MTINNNQVAISDFKKHCLQLLQNLQTSDKPLTITKRSVPIAQVLPLTPEIENKQSCFGFLKNTVTIHEDIENFSTEDEWNINNE